MRISRKISEVLEVSVQYYRVLVEKNDNFIRRVSFYNIAELLFFIRSLLASENNERKEAILSLLHLYDFSKGIFNF